MHRDQAVDHVALTLPHLLHIDGDGTGRDPELAGVTKEVCGIRTPDLILAGQAVDVRTGATNPPALDDGHPLPGLCQVPRQILPPFAAAQDNHVIAFRFGHVSVLSRPVITRVRRKAPTASASGRAPLCFSWRS